MGVFTRERPELDPCVRAIGQHQAARDVAASDQHDPSRGLELERERLEQRRRCGVHQMRLLDLDDRRDDQRAAEEPEHDFMQLGGADASASCSTSVDGGISTSSTIAISEQPGHQVRVVGFDLRSQPVEHDPRRARPTSTPSSCRSRPRQAE